LSNQTLRDEAHAQEIDRRIQLEAELSDQLATETRRGAANDDLFRLLVESVTDYAIFMLDLRGVVTTWNAGAQRLKGYRADEIIGSHFSRFYQAAEVLAGKCAHELEVALATGRFEDEGWRVRKDGSTFWASVAIAAVRDDAGVPIGFAKVTRDLTDQKAEEERRLAAEERFRLLVESVQDYALLILDPEGRIATWNVGAERIKGYAASEIIGDHFSRFYPAEDVAAGKCEHELEVAAREGRFEDENWRVRKDGSQFWANVVISAIRDRAGALVGYSKVTRDLTERRRSEVERTARLAAEQASRAKDEFLAMLGHELRNPLAPILTALELMQLRAPDTFERERTVILRQVRHVGRLVDDLLDVSRITRGEVQLHVDDLDVAETINKAIEIASPLLEERTHELITTVARGLMVRGDAVRLAQVVANLLTNAAKYTERGGVITISTTRESERIAIRVGDNGVGIAPEVQPHVFDTFYQSRQAIDRAQGGLGLGLAIVRTLVELHGGEVKVASAGLGKGSEFTVWIPALPASHAPRPVIGTPPRGALPLRSEGILIVDDNADALGLLGDALEARGLIIHRAHDAPSALALAPKVMPRIALLDVGLPVMDGYELGRRLRELPGLEAIKLVAVTGYGQASDLARSEAAGFEAHLVKPISLAVVHRTIEQLLGGPIV